MRVVAGTYGSRPLKPVPGKDTRPTSDKVRGAIFNQLGIWLDGGLVLDVYSGTGALGIEAVSRGADGAYLCERNPKAVQVIKANVAMTGESDKFIILSGDNRRSLQGLLGQNQPRFSWVFLDPPYAKGRYEEDIIWLEKADLLDEGAVIVCEADSQVVLLDKIGSWVKYKEKTYGQTRVALYEREEEMDD